MCCSVVDFDKQIIQRETMVGKKTKGKLLIICDMKRKCTVKLNYCFFLYCCIVTERVECTVK